MICWEHTAVKGFGACCLPGFGTAFLKIVEDGVIPKNQGFPWSCFFLHFPKRFPFLVFCEESCLFPCDWKARKLFESSAPSRGEYLAAWLEVHMTVTAPTHGTSTPVPSFCSARGAYRVLISHVFSVWHPRVISCSLSPLWGCFSLPSSDIQ